MGVALNAKIFYIFFMCFKYQSFMVIAQDASQYDF